MTGLLAVALTVTAVGTAGGVLLAAASWRAALRVLLELLTAAGLVRLATARTWTDVATVAVIVVIRTVLSAVLLGPASAPGPGAGSGPASIAGPASRPAR